MWEKIKNFLHWRKASRPEVDIDSEIYAHLRPFRLPLVLLISLSMIGTLGYVLIDNMSLDDAIYQTGITFTTTGFGEVTEISTAGRFFTITLIVLGFAVFTSSLGVLTEVISRGKLTKLIKERNMLYKIARIKNHFVIFFHNENTIELAREFRTLHVPFVVVDGSEKFLDEAEKHKYPYYINEAPHLDSAIRKSHLSSAKGAICLSKNLSDNIAMISTIRLFEKELGRKPFLIIASSENENDTIKLKKLGADSIVSPTKLLAQRISAISVRPEMENMLEMFLYRRDTPIDMEEIVVPKHSWMIFKRLKETHLREITRTSIVGISEKDGKFIPMPSGETQIMVDSKLIVVGTYKGIEDAKRIIKRREKPEELRYA